MADTNFGLDANNPKFLKRARPVEIAMGAALVLIGLVALLAFFSDDPVRVTFMGWLFMMAGIFQFVFSFASGRWSGSAMLLLLSVIYLYTGGYLVWGPVMGAQALALFLSVLFLASGVFRIIVSLTTRLVTWRWALATGIISALMGAYATVRPSVGVGRNMDLLIAIDFICFGAFILAFGMSKEALHVEEPEGTPAQV